MATLSPAEAWLTGPSSTQFYTRTYTPTTSPAKAVVVALHGFAEHIGRYTHYHPLIAARGIAVFAFDQRGFGLTAQDTTGKKSKDSAYGKTSWKEQMVDIEWAVAHTKKQFADVPLFLMGHSMGGGEVLGFATHGGDKHKATFDLLSGIIATSPLIAQTTPAPKIAKWAGGKLSVILPNMLIPAEVKAEQLSHDAEVNSAYLKDPLIKQAGSLKGIHDMLSNGDILLKHGVKHWPAHLPLLIAHGTADEVTSPKASQTFHDQISASKKKITLFPGGYHELHNEPNGVKEKLADEIVAFIEEHSSSAATPAPVITDEAPANAEPESAAPESTTVDGAKSKM